MTTKTFEKNDGDNTDGELSANENEDADVDVDANANANADADVDANANADADADADAHYSEKNTLQRQNEANAHEMHCKNRGIYQGAVSSATALDQPRRRG